MRRLGVATLLVLLAGLVSSVVALASTHDRTGMRAAKSPSQIELARNKAAAHADAKHLVALVKLPSGSLRSATEPRGDHGLLKPAKSLEAVLTDRLAHAWYIVPAATPNPYRFVEKHPPGGVQNDGTALTVGPDGTVHTLIYNFPDRRRVFARLLEVTFAKLKDGDTGVMIVAQSNWILPRPSSEKVPAAASQVLITSTTSSASVGSEGLYPVITSNAEVRKLIKIVDTPPIAQDEVSAGCPVYAGKQHTVSIKFGDTSDQTLAEATVSWTGNEPVGSWCDAIGFKIGKKSEPNLVDTHFLTQIQKVTKLKLR